MAFPSECFDYFAKNICKKFKPKKSLAQIRCGKIIEKQSIFSQESFVVDAVKKTIRLSSIFHQSECS